MTKSMNENAKKWVAELRSGRWLQARNALSYNRKSFCCLGVACELYEQTVGGLRIKKLPGGKISYNEFSDLLPDTVRDWIGLVDRGGNYSITNSVHPEEITGNLTVDNDSGKTFSEIANIIEAHSELFQQK